MLLGKNHKKLWEITKETLKRLVSAEVFKGTEAKIDGSLAAGYGTILFFEDKAVVEQLQDSFPTYYDKFPVWAQQTSAMHQLAIWTMLEDAGLGVSLQHYNPLIDETVYAEWKLDPKWELVAQMPFGTPTEGPGPGVGYECECQHGTHLNEDHYFPEIIDPNTLQPVEQIGRAHV